MEEKANTATHFDFRLAKLSRYIFVTLYFISMQQNCMSVLRHEQFSLCDTSSLGCSLHIGMI